MQDTLEWDKEGIYEVDDAATIAFWFDHGISHLQKQVLDMTCS